MHLTLLSLNELSNSNMYLKKDIDVIFRIWHVFGILKR